jgi:CHAT domain-containing protein
VEYSLGRERSYAWVLTKGRLTSFTLPRRDRIEGLSSSVARLMARSRERQDGPENERRMRQDIAALRKEVYAPVEAAVQGRRAIVVADGALQMVPFAVLDGLRREIVELPSAWTLAMQRSQRMRPGKGMRIFADPVFEASDPRIPQQPERRQPSSGVLARLPFSQEEAKGIRDLVAPGAVDVSMGLDATKEAFLSPTTAAYRYVHVSTHAMVDVQRPELSRIVLSRVDPGGKRRDGEIRLYELYGFRTTADLVTLSACRTGSGRQTNGEGVIGLSRAFLFAGAKSVLVTLWPVEDEGTAVFMREFYRGLLGDKLSRPGALVAAQRYMRAQERWRDPYYWAGFVLQGDWR